MLGRGPGVLWWQGSSPGGARSSCGDGAGAVAAGLALVWWAAGMGSVAWTARCGGAGKYLTRRLACDKLS